MIQHILHAYRSHVTIPMMIFRSVLRPGNWQPCHGGGDATDDGPDWLGDLVRLFHHPNNPWVTTHPKWPKLEKIKFSAQRKWSKIPKSKLQKFAHTWSMTAWQSWNHHLEFIKPVVENDLQISVARNKYHHHIEILICKRMQYLNSISQTSFISRHRWRIFLAPTQPPAHSLEIHLSSLPQRRWTIAASNSHRFFSLRLRPRQIGLSSSESRWHTNSSIPCKLRLYTLFATWHGN